MNAHLPILNTCNLKDKQDRPTNLIVHCLDELLNENVFIPENPHRHSFYQIIFIEKGSGTHKIDFVDYKIENNSLFFLAPGQTHNLNLETTSKGMLINFDESLFHTFLVNSSSINDYPFFWKNGKNSKYKLEKNSIIFDVLSRIRNNRKERKLIRLYLLELFHLVYNLTKSELDDTFISETIISKFEKLIDKNYHKEHYPKFYAEKLFITPNYLNGICKKETSKTAGELIRERVILEIKRLLINSDLTISEIAYSLGFEDNSYFTKFFKQIEGITPTQFRIVFSNK